MKTADQPQAAPTRTGHDIDLLNRIDLRLRAFASSLGAREMQYPALISRPVLERAGYPRAFPHLLMSASRHDGGIAQDWCLSPAVCYHAFAHLAGRVMEDATVLTARGRCFRAEQETAPGIRQIEFEMREIVLFGPIAWIDGCADMARLAIQTTAVQLGLTGEWQAADSDGGAAGAFISHYVIPTSGTYSFSVQGPNWLGSTVGGYQTHLELARGIQQESDRGFSNDSVAGANAVNLSTGAPPISDRRLIGGRLGCSGYHQRPNH